jgi:hypothetical protein
VISNRFYTVNGEKWEARFFTKGEIFPHTDGMKVARQGVWARPVDSGWERGLFVGISWQEVSMDPDVLYMPTHK